MVLVGERQVPDGPSAPSPTPTTTPPPSPAQVQEFIHRAAWKAGVLGAINVAVQVLAVRLILLLSVIGAIVLTVIALKQPDVFRLVAIGLYFGGVLLPITWLAGRGH